MNPQPALEMHESEVSFQAVVDPYARADFFISFGEEGVELEEGFITFPALPGGLLVQVGKMRAAFGKVNTLHNHVLPWTDRPLVINNLVGGEEGIDDAGISVARLIPNPWFFLEATGQVFRGDSSDLFHSSERGDLTLRRPSARLSGHDGEHEHRPRRLVTHMVTTRPASSTTSISAGSRHRLYGIDATVRWKPLQRSIYRSFVGRSELIWSRREQPRLDTKRVWLLRVWRLSVRPSMVCGRRATTVPRMRTTTTLRDTGQSLLLTYWPSEFSQVRGNTVGRSTPSAIWRMNFFFNFSSRSERMVRTRSEAVRGYRLSVEELHI